MRLAACRGIVQPVPIRPQWKQGNYPVFLIYAHRYDFKIAMVEQLDMKRRKEEIILDKKLENTLEDYINGFHLFEK